MPTAVASILDLEHTTGPDRRTVKGTFFPDAANQPTYRTNDKHPGWSVVWTSQGLYTITFDDVGRGIVEKTHSLQVPAAGSARFLQFGAYVAASRTLQIRVVDAAGAVQNLGVANADNSISFEVTFNDSSIL